MEEKLQMLAKMLATNYGLVSPALNLHETFDQGRFSTYMVVDGKDTLYKLVVYPQGNFNSDNDLVRHMKDAEEILFIEDYELVKPLENYPQYTLYKITLEEGYEI